MFFFFVTFLNCNSTKLDNKYIKSFELPASNNNVEFLKIINSKKNKKKYFVIYQKKQYAFLKLDSILKKLNNEALLRVNNDSIKNIIFLHINKKEN